MKKVYLHIIYIVAGIFISHGVTGQNISDVIRWSTIDYTGSARTLGVGSSFGAMGGDFTSLNINPAGIGDLRISEFNITPSMRNTETESFFIKDKDNRNTLKSSKLGLDQIGFVFASAPGSKWTSSNFAIGYSRTADLNRGVNLSGKIPGSITNYFIERANGVSVDDLDEYSAYPAFNTGAIFDPANNRQYQSDFPSASTEVNRKQDITYKGGINELSLGWAGEYKNRINFGLSVGVPFGRFEEYKTYEENDESDAIPVFTRLLFQENLNTSGVGVNVKAGFIYKMDNKIRIAGAFHSPTWYRFKDDYGATMTYSFVDNGPKSFSYNSTDGQFEYEITTPWRAIGSIGTIYKVGTIAGFINADVEHLDYTSAVYDGTAFNNSPDEFSYTREVNNDIQSRLSSTTNFRIGTELAMSNIRFRVGHSWVKTAFKNDDFYNSNLSFGLGYREDNFFIDLGVRMANSTEGFLPYAVSTTNLNPTADINTNRNRASVTLGFKF